MVIKCPNCNGALEYNVEKGLMYCKFCDSYFTAEEIAMPETDPVDDEVAETAPASAQAQTSWQPNDPFPVTKSRGPGFSSMSEISQSATNARMENNTGGIVYNYTDEEREAKRRAFYEEQDKMHQEFINAPKVDYTKPYVSKADAKDDILSPAEMALAASAAGMASGKDRVKQYYEEQARLHEEYVNRPQADYTKPYSGTTREGKSEAEIQAMNARSEASRYDELHPKTVGQVGRDAFDFNSYYQRNPEMRVNHSMQQVDKNGVRYTPGGARIINSVNMMLTTDAPIEDGVARIDHKVYTCTSCGAELSLTGVETSSFCAYCGQPTIVYSRMESTLMPDSIIPFVITREKALKLVRDRLNKGFFIPKEVKNFEVERLNGIYIPYWLFDAVYDDSMVIRTKVKSGKSTVTRYYRVNTHANLFYFPVDASKTLNDYSSRKLEPYDYAGIRPFNVSYMSGFYSDRFDMSADTMMMTSMYRAQSMMYEQAKKKVPGSPTGMVDSYPTYHVKKKYYTLLPAWFMTFRYEGEPYTIMVNGQTGKVVGAVPYSRKNFWGMLVGLTAAFSAILVPVSIAVCRAMLSSTTNSRSDGEGKFFAMVLFAIGALFVAGSSIMQKYKKNMALTKEAKLNKFTRERQEL